MTGNDVDSMGGTTVIEDVNQPTDESQSDSQSSSESSKVPETVPYDRFSEVNSEKNVLKKKYDEQVALNNQLSQNVNQYLESHKSPDVTTPQIESIDDVVSYINKEIDSKVKPIEQKRLQETYVNNVNNYFSGDKQASEIRDQIDQYYNNLPSYRQESIYDAVSRGDVSVLDELKATVSMKHNSNLKSMADEAVVTESTRTIAPNTNKVIRDSKPGLSDLISKGKKEGNFGNFFTQFVQDSGLA